MKKIELRGFVDVPDWLSPDFFLGAKWVAPVIEDAISGQRLVVSDLRVFHAVDRSADAED